MGVGVGVTVVVVVGREPYERYFLLCLPGANIIKLFEPYGMNSRNELVFAPGKPFQLSLLFWGKAMSLPLSGAPERCFPMVGS